MISPFPQKKKLVTSKSLRNDDELSFSSPGESAKYIVENIVGNNVQEMFQSQKNVCILLNTVEPQ